MTVLSCSNIVNVPAPMQPNNLADNVPEEVKIARLNQLIHLQTAISAEQNKKDEGREFVILTERFSKKDRHHLMGRTEQTKPSLSKKAITT